MSPFRLIYGARSGDGVFELVLKQSGRNLIVPADRTAVDL
jgi:hypothetical protein